MAGKVSVVSPVADSAWEACHVAIGAYVAQAPLDPSTISIFTGPRKLVLSVLVPELKAAILRPQDPPLTQMGELLATCVWIFAAAAVGAVNDVS
jgi:hypothetical protein